MSPVSPNLICPLNIFSVFIQSCSSGNTCFMLLMDHFVEQNESSQTKANIKLSLRQTNNGEKSKKCSLCDSVFSRKRQLRVHLKTHSGEKSNKCNHCDYASSQAGHLRRHMITHSGGKKNKCSQCDQISVSVMPFSPQTSSRSKSR